MYMGSYESSIDAQTLDAKRLEIEKCTYLRWGYTFIDIHSHYWQFHSNYIKPNAMKSSRTMDTITKSQESGVNQIGSNTEKDDESADKAKLEVKHEMLSTQPAKNSSHRAPGIEAGEEPAPTLEYRMEFSLNEEDEAIKVEDNEHMLATEYEPDSSTNVAKKYATKEEKTENNETKDEREKRTGPLNITQPPDESCKNNNKGNDVKISAEPISGTDESNKNDKKSKHKTHEAVASELCEKSIDKASSLNVHMTNFAKIS